MRKCIRCNCDMVENFDVKVEGGANGLRITEQGVFKDNLGKVNVAVFPECGILNSILKILKRYEIDLEISMYEKNKLVYSYEPGWLYRG